MEPIGGWDNMAFFLYASFPNSRQRNRSPTRVANTFQVLINNQGDTPITELVDADENRTALTLENTSVTDDMYYTYVTKLAVDPSVVATFGLPNDHVLDTVSGLLYIKSDTGITTNWTITTVQVSGFLIRAAQSVDIQSLQVVVAQAAEILPLNPITIDIDYGRA